MTDTIILYLHGFRSSPQGSKINNLKTMFPDIKIIGVPYTPHDPDSAAQTLTDIMTTTCKNHEVLVIGTSLGGFWARWMANQFKVRSIMINPSLHPDKTLSAGTYLTYEDPPKLITVSRENLESFNRYKINKNESNAGSAHVWVALDDEVLDAHNTIEELQGQYQITKFKTGGHRFSQFSKMKNRITQCLNS
jgi:hypothetical protein